MAQIHTVLFLSFLSKFQFIVLSFIQYRKYTNLQSKCMDLFPLSAQHLTLRLGITRRSATTQRKRGMCELEEDREIVELFALVGLSPYQLHTTLCSHLEKQNKKTLLLLGIGGISNGRISPGQRKWPAILICLTDVVARFTGMGTLHFYLALRLHADGGLWSGVWSKLLSL